MEAITALGTALVERWVIVATAALVLVSSLLVPIFVSHVSMWNIPMIGEELGGLEKRRQAYLAGSKDLYSQGYKKFKNGIFRITATHNLPTIVLSPDFLSELRKLPDDTVSFDGAVDEFMEVKYTKIVTNMPIIAHTVKTALTPSLPKLNETISLEVQDALRLEMPDAEDWTEIDIHHVLLRVVAMVSGRVFVGPELCRSEKYLDAAINYTVDVIAVQRAVSKIAVWKRPFLASRIPERKRLEKRIEEMGTLLKPLVEERRRMTSVAGYEKPNDMIQWLVDAQSKFTDEKSQNLAQAQLGLIFAAIHTTTLTGTNAFYDIAALPEFIPELRDEIREAIAKEDGHFTSNALQSMKKMDSFLKEMVRFRPFSMTSFQRKVLRTFTLSNGQTIPAGTMIEVPSAGVYSDPEVFPDADKYDPLRFYKLRENARAKGAHEAAATNQFVSVSQNSLTFGFGRHACPGRFFAANEVKMIMANVLLDYDLKMTEGSVERYPNIEFANQSIPDPTRRLLCRKVKA